MSKKLYRQINARLLSILKKDVRKQLPIENVIVQLMKEFKVPRSTILEAFANDTS